MLKGRELLGYAVNEMGGDKLMTLYKIADELLNLADWILKVAGKGTYGTINSRNFNKICQKFKNKEK